MRNFSYLFQQLVVRPSGSLTRKVDPLPVEALEGIPQGRAVHLAEDVAAHFDRVVGAYGHEQAVECCVMDLAHGYAVRDHRLTADGITPNVCRIEQLEVSKPAEGTSVVVRSEHLGPEYGLVEALAHNAVGVS